MNTVIAGKSGMFGSARERKRQQATAPYAVYAIKGGKFWVLNMGFAEDIAKAGRSFAEYKGWEFQDRTGEEGKGA